MGLFSIKIEVSGKSLNLEREAGGHRIQRVPPTEKRGRVQTSSVTVAVVDDIDISKEYTDDDFSVEWFSGTGKGGQHKNKVQCSCRVIHKETGLSETRQSRSRKNNYRDAKESLIKRLKQNQSSTVKNEIDATRKNQVGSGMRGDKIRTYRFQDDVVTDHISNKRAKVSKVMKGQFSLLY